MNKTFKCLKVEMAITWLMLLLACFVSFAKLQYIHYPKDKCEDNFNNPELLNVFKDEFHDLRLKIDKLQEDNLQLREMLTKSEKKFPTSCSDAIDEFQPGFTLTFAAQTITTKETPLKIGNIISNYGSILTENNEFVICRDGVYEFLLHLVTESSENGAWIYKNNKPMTLVWQSGPVNVTGVVSGTTSSVVELFAGDSISIRSYRGDLRVSGFSAWSGHIVSNLFYKASVLVVTLQLPDYSSFAFGRHIITKIGITP
ncbi:uncharacterized protein LOC134236132 [Saccostrea cucullata]|uniref:uncharacterized protein LOC134236132 n=1 Tax=Saccostrea cuccullata TaxID=36930 RepID=UPI002ED2E036